MLVRNLILIGLVSLSLTGARFPHKRQTAAVEPAADHDARMAWWREARFGMFIHWGVYSVPAGQWDGKPVGGGGEWIMTIGHIPLAKYEELPGEFNPVNFDAEKWAQIAADAGMKYVVITSKHHDGFCMFDTKVTPYNIVAATPWKKDPLAELSAACKRHGIRFCVYYSIMDWHNPNQAPAKPDAQHPDYNPTHFIAGRKDAYIAEMKQQLAELITQYHPGVLWFDGQWMGGWTEADGKDLYAYLRGLDPALIVNDRIVGGDFGTPEQTIPATGLPGRDWETCMTLNNTWGYKSDDTDFKPAAKLIANLIDTASKGGNYLLNVGPNALGEIPEGEVSRLKQMGDWLKINGGAIYGTTASPFHKLTFDGRCTRKGNTLYLTVFNWPAEGIKLGGVKSALQSARFVDGNVAGEVTAENDGAGPVLTIKPPAKLDPVATVVAVKFADPLVIEDTSGVVRAAADGKLVCNASDAATHGDKVRLEEQDGVTNVGYWIDPKDYVTWDLLVPAEGDYDVSMNYASPGKGDYIISVVSTSIAGQVAATGSWNTFKTATAGKLHLAAGRQTLNVIPGTPRPAVMNLRQVILTPAAKN
jgi:alpha-L-fucosidase